MLAYNQGECLARILKDRDRSKFMRAVDPDNFIRSVRVVTPQRRIQKYLWRSWAGVAVVAVVAQLMLIEQLYGQDHHLVVDKMWLTKQHALYCDIASSKH